MPPRCPPAAPPGAPGWAVITAAPSSRQHPGTCPWGGTAPCGTRGTHGIDTHGTATAASPGLVVGTLRPAGGCRCQACCPGAVCALLGTAQGWGVSAAGGMHRTPPLRHGQASPGSAAAAHGQRQLRPAAGVLQLLSLHGRLRRSAALRRGGHEPRGSPTSTGRRQLPPDPRRWPRCPRWDAEHGDAEPPGHRVGAGAGGGAVPVAPRCGARGDAAGAASARGWRAPVSAAWAALAGTGGAGGRGAKPSAPRSRCQRFLQSPEARLTLPGFASSSGTAACAVTPLAAGK